MFSIYKKVTRGSLIINFFASFLSSSYYLFKSNNFIINFTITVMIITIVIIIVILINITVTVILEKSSGGEF